VRLASKRRKGTRAEGAPAVLRPQKVVRLSAAKKRRRPSVETEDRLRRGASALLGDLATRGCGSAHGPPQSRTRVAPLAGPCLGRVMRSPQRPPKSSLALNSAVLAACVRD